MQRSIRKVTKGEKKSSEGFGSGRRKVAVF